MIFYSNIDLWRTALIIMMRLDWEIIEKNPEYGGQCIFIGR